MAVPGESVYVRVPAKFFVAGSFLEFKIKVEYTIWEDMTYTIFGTTMEIPGYPDQAVPQAFKDRFMKDRNFTKAMIDEIQRLHLLGLR
jgi:hypothetical protein